MLHFVWYLLVGLAAGWMAGMLTRGKGFGWLGNLAVGVIGALLGGFLYGLIPQAIKDTIGSIMLATIGAILLLYIMSWFTRNVKA